MSYTETTDGTIHHHRHHLGFDCPVKVVPRGYQHLPYPKTTRNKSGLFYVFAVPRALQEAMLAAIERFRDAPRREEILEGLKALKQQENGK